MMAMNDYLGCGKCGCKTIYDAEVVYEHANISDITALCKKCFNTHEIVIRDKFNKDEISRDLPYWLESSYEIAE